MKLLKNKKQEAPVILDDMFGVGSSTDFTKSLETMFNDESIERKTDLTSRQICKLNLIKQMADFYYEENDENPLEEMYIRFISLRVSKERKGRTEGVQMTQ